MARPGTTQAQGSPAEILAGLGGQWTVRMQQKLESALSGEEITAYNQAADSVQKKTGIRAHLQRTYGHSEFFTWLVAEKGLSVDDVFDLPEKRSQQEIHDLFVEFTRDLNTVYSITPESARLLGERQSRFLEAMADAHFPDTDPKTPEEVCDAMEKAAFLNEILVDWIQDTPGLTGISAGTDFNPERSAAFFNGAGGKDSYEGRLQRLHGKLVGLTGLFSSAFPATDAPVEMATRMSWFRDIWQGHRGKRLADVESAGFSTQDYINKGITKEASELDFNPEPITEEMEAEAQAYLAGGAGELSWKARADERYAKHCEGARQSENNQVDVGSYKLSLIPFDRQQITVDLPAADTDIRTMTEQQRKDALDKVSVGYQKTFGTSLDTRILEPLYTRGKDTFDVIKIDGRSVRELADAELAGQAWAQPQTPDGPEPVQKVQYMQMMVLKKMCDPQSNVSITLAHVDEKGQLKDLPPIELSAPARELKLGTVDPFYKDTDLAEAARNLLVEGFQGTSIPQDVYALASGFGQAKKIAIPKSQQDALKRLNKDIYDTIFINGRSVNDIFRETYGNRFDNRPDTKAVLKDALIMANRMQPDCKIEMWRVDENATTLEFTEPVSIGVREDVKGLSLIEKRDIHELNTGLTMMSPEARKNMAAVPSLGQGVSIDKLKQIDEIWAKMESEKQGLHRDSAKYREMKEAVKAVHDAMAGFHPSDPNCQADMRRLLGNVNRTASLYAEDKVYDKTKRTSRGVERKNTALALMDLAGGQIDENRVQDKRLHSSEVVKQGKKLKDLIDEEHAETSAKHSGKAEKSRRDRRRETADKRRETDRTVTTG